MPPPEYSGIDSTTPTLLLMGLPGAPLPLLMTASLALPLVARRFTVG